MVWIDWSPGFAPHVKGRYEKREFEEVGGAMLPLPQKVEVVCEVCQKDCKCSSREVCRCGAFWRTTCSTGAVRTHIQTFAGLHLHRDPLSPVPQTGLR